MYPDIRGDTQKSIQGRGRSRGVLNRDTLETEAGAGNRTGKETGAVEAGAVEAGARAEGGRS